MTRTIRDLYAEQLTREFSRIPVEEMERLHEEYLATGDTELRDTLVLRAAPLVVALLKKLNIRNDFRDDALQAGNLAVIRAVDSWDPERGFSFTSWACYKAAKDMVREVEFVAGKDTLSLDVATIEWLSSREGEDPEHEAILEFAKGVSLSIPTDNDRNENLEASVLSSQLRQAVEDLSYRDRYILERTLEDVGIAEIGRELGISRQAAHAHYQALLGRLRTFLVE